MICAASPRPDKVRCGARRQSRALEFQPLGPAGRCRASPTAARPQPEYARRPAVRLRVLTGDVVADILEATEESRRIFEAMSLHRGLSSRSYRSAASSFDTSAPLSSSAMPASRTVTTAVSAPVILPSLRLRCRCTQLKQSDRQPFHPGAMRVAAREITPLGARATVFGEAEHRRRAALPFETEPQYGSLRRDVA